VSGRFSRIAAPGVIPPARFPAPPFWPKPKKTFANRCRLQVEVEETKEITLSTRHSNYSRSLLFSGGGFQGLPANPEPEKTFISHTGRSVRRAHLRRRLCAALLARGLKHQVSFQLSTIDCQLAAAKPKRKAKKKLIATTPKLKIAATVSKQTTSQKLIATKTPLPLRQTFAPLPAPASCGTLPPGEPANAEPRRRLETALRVHPK
jgi:hypothetical protein